MLKLVHWSQNAQIQLSPHTKVLSTTPHALPQVKTTIQHPTPMQDFHPDASGGYNSSGIDTSTPHGQEKSIPNSHRNRPLHRSQVQVKSKYKKVE